MKESIYETPRSSMAPIAQKDNTKIYSPNQILGGSFWGGPIAATYFLRENYLALGKAEYAQKTLIFGSLFIVALLGALPFLPENFPNMAIPLVYSLLAKQLANTTQLEKKKIEESENYSFHSNWKVFGIGTLTLLLFLTAAGLVVFTMDTFGVISLS